MENLLLENYYEAIFEKSLDGIMLTKPDGGIYRANPAMCRMLQRTEEDICRVGRNGILDVQDPRLHTALEERIRNGNVRVELVFIRQDGIRFPVDLTSVIVQGKDNQVWTVIICRDISLIKQTETQLRFAKDEAVYLATNDYLTRVLNRRGFTLRLEQEISRSKRSGESLCLILIDLDQFKRINDDYGHSFGDFALKKFTAQLECSTRTYDVLGRFGGDEFVVLLPNTELGVATGIAVRMQQQIEELEIPLKEQQIKLTASFGVAQYDGAVAEELEAFITRTDNNMYIAKEKGNSVYSR